MILAGSRGGKGRRLVIGGQAIGRDGGYYIEPTVFATPEAGWLSMKFSVRVGRDPAAIRRRNSSSTAPNMV
jgi:hypothetical protein